MNRIVLPGVRTGEVDIPSSKSQLHRLLICASLGEQDVIIRGRGLPEDICATIDSLTALGASIEVKSEGFLVHPIAQEPKRNCRLACRESGSTLRFILPLVGALGVQATFLREGKLPQRPIGSLCDALRRNGMNICERDALLQCSGKLHSGEFSIPGDISSQFISALLMTLPLLDGESILRILGKSESAPYIAMTEEVLRTGGILYTKEENVYQIPGSQRYRLPSELTAEGDYSNAAFFLCAGALSKDGVRINGINRVSLQGDQKIASILQKMGALVTYDKNSIMVRRGTLHGLEVDASATPDLVPALSVVASVASGETRIIHAQRLRLKESDRLRATANMLNALGGHVQETADGLLIRGDERLSGGVVNPCGDHRIAMAAAVAACACRREVTIINSECVCKSYPDFWDDFDHLKGELL